MRSELMATPVLDVGIFTPTELQALFVAAKAEYLRALAGRMVQGSSAAQSYGLTTMSIADLVSLLNAIGAELGIGANEIRVRPNFNGPEVPGYPNGFGA